MEVDAFPGPPIRSRVIRRGARLAARPRTRAVPVDGRWASLDRPRRALLPEESCALQDEAVEQGRAKTKARSVLRS